MVGDVIRDFKYAIRSFVRRPLFTAVIVLTLALGIGSNVAMFSVANAVLLRALPYDHPEELALVWTRLQATNVERSLVSGPDLGDYQTQTTRFEGFAGAVAVPGTLTGSGQAERIMNGYTTWNLFELLGVRPLLGRTFRKDDAITIDPKQFANPNPDLPPGKVMLSYGLWQRRFGGDPGVIGRTIQMDGWGSVVVGVLPPTFRIYLPADAAMPTNVDAWGVLPTNISDFARDAAWLTVVTRLRDGVTLEQAQQEMDAVATRLREVHPFHKTQNLHIRVNGLHRDVVSHARPALLALLGAVGFVLLIACANIANLLLVRATERGREIAVRAAVGSGRGRIIAQMLVESAVLSWAGAVLGVLLAWQGIRLITALSPGNLPRVERRGHRPRRAPVHRGGCVRRRDRVRARAGAASGRRQPGGRAARPGKRHGRCARQQAAQRARRSGGRAVARAADRRRVDGPQLRPDPAGRPGVRRAERRHIQCTPAVSQVPHVGQAGELRQRAGRSAPGHSGGRARGRRHAAAARGRRAGTPSGRTAASAARTTPIGPTRPTTRRCCRDTSKP